MVKLLESLKPHTLILDMLSLGNSMLLIGMWYIFVQSAAAATMTKRFVLVAGRTGSTAA